MRAGRIVLLCAFSFLLALVAYLALLSLALKVTSDRRIAMHLQSSVEDALLSEDAVSQPSNFGHTAHGYDMFSECVGMSTNLGNVDRSLTYRVLASPYISSHPDLPAGFGQTDPCKDLVHSLTGQPRAALLYPRFWHGYQVYMRVVLSLTGLQYLRVLNAVLMDGCLLYLCFQLRDWFGWMAVPIFLLPYALGSDLLSAPLVTVQAIPLAWSYLSVALGMRLLEARRGTSTRFFVFSFLSGSVYNFLSMLFTPQLTPALLAFMTLAAYLRWGRQTTRRSAALLQAGLTALAWFLGFALTWIAKWALAAAYLGLDTIRTSVLAAASGVNYSSHAIPLAHARFGTTLRVFLPHLLLPTLVTLVVVTAIVVLREPPAGSTRGKQITDYGMLLTPLLIVITWTEMMHYHSFEHVIFAQRAIMLFIILPLLALLLLNRRHRDGTADFEA